MIGRAAGSVEGFNYSPALRDVGITWTADTLETYLANPTGIVRGKRMVQRFNNADERRTIIEFLGSKQRGGEVSFGYAAQRHDASKQTVGAMKAKAQLLMQKLRRAANSGRSAAPTACQDVADGIAQEELNGLSYMFRGRLAALAMLAVWAATLPFERSAGYLSAIAAFALLGAPPYLLARQAYGRAPVLAAFLMLDAAILTYVYVRVMPPPFYVEDWTAQLNLRLSNFLYLGIFLVGMSLSYSPWLVIWAGIAAMGRLEPSLPVGCIAARHFDDDFAPESGQRHELGSGHRALPRSEIGEPHDFFNQIVFLGLVTLIVTANRLALARGPALRPALSSRGRAT